MEDLHPSLKSHLTPTQGAETLLNQSLTFGRRLREVVHREWHSAEITSAKRREALKYLAGAFLPLNPSRQPTSLSPPPLHLENIE